MVLRNQETVVLQPPSRDLREAQAMFLRGCLQLRDHSLGALVPPYKGEAQRPLRIEVRAWLRSGASEVLSGEEPTAKGERGQLAKPHTFDGHPRGDLGRSDSREGGVRSELEPELA